MAKKQEQKTTDTPKDKADETQNTTGDTLPPDNADTAEAAPKAETETTDGVEQLEDTGKADKDDAIKIDPIAFEIKLKAHHPSDSYGRCGYRFNKTESVEIAKDALTDAQIIALAQDPWLEFVPVCEE